MKPSSSLEHIERQRDSLSGAALVCAPRGAERARTIDVDAARRVIVRRYIETVTACTIPMICRVFGLPRAVIHAAVDDLRARGVIVEESDWIVRKSG